MILEALSPSCVSDLYVLKLGGRSIGEYRGRWFSESVEVRLTSRRRLSLKKDGWMESRFVLAEFTDGRVIAEADRRTAARLRK